jgi:phospholipid/cholesterol/gamma-HCH transport system ATP-binding protein
MRIFGARSAVSTEPAPGAKDDPVHIRVRDVHKHYGPHHVLKGVSFDILRKRTNVVIGPSGSGKSVLMRQIIRLEKPDSGQVLVDGIDYAVLEGMALERKRRGMGMVFQMSALFDSMTVLANKGPAELSGGMQRRVAVARAVVLETDVLIYDEPTTGLDPLTVRTVDELIAETEAKFGVTSIVISHDMASVFRIADRLTFLNFGEVVVSGGPGEVIDQLDDSLREFIDASGVSREFIAAHARR